MKIFKTSTISTLAAALVLFASPTAEAKVGNDDGMLLRSAQRRCSRTAGREHRRCVYNSRRTTSRYRYADTQAFARRVHTLRDLRMVGKNKPVDNIRGRGSQGVVRHHMRAGGRSRRTIHESDRAARAQCRGLKGTEKFTCIRKRWRGSGIDNTLGES